MKQLPFLLLITLSLGLTACRATPPSPSGPSPGEAHAAASLGSGFDYYLLNLSWSPEFCYSHPGAAECASHARFVLHGLWPQNQDGTYPENCSAAPGPSDPAAYRDIYPDPGLLGHEWHAHGTCSGLSPDAFFTNARSAVKSISIPPALENLSRPTSMPPDQIVSLFTEANPAIAAEGVAVSCGNNFLTAVQICLDKTLHPIRCGPVRSCRAGTVRIPPPR